MPDDVRVEKAESDAIRVCAVGELVKCRSCHNQLWFMDLITSGRLIRRALQDLRKAS